MNYFEQELQRVATYCSGIDNTVFAGRACYADLGGDNRVKLQFVTHGVHAKYEALKVTVLNRTDGDVDTLLLRFSDTWGKKKVSNPNFKNGIIPYIWTYNGESEWYVYRPTDADMKKLAQEVNTYINVFTDRSSVKEQTKSEEKASVVKTLRDSKQATIPTTGKSKVPSRSRTKQEL